MFDVEYTPQHPEPLPYTLHPSGSDYLAYWDDVAERRKDIESIAQSNASRVYNLHQRLMRGDATPNQALELGMSLGATNRMRGGEVVLLRVFERVLQRNNPNFQINWQSPDVISEVHDGLLEFFLESDADSFIAEVEGLEDSSLANQYTFYAAQFLHEVAELPRYHLDYDQRQTLLYGAIDLYEHLWSSPDSGWYSREKRSSLGHWHSAFSALIAGEIAGLSQDDPRRDELEKLFAEIQISTITNLLAAAREECEHTDNDSGDSYEHFHMANGEMFEYYTVVAGWFLIAEEQLFDRFSINLAKERQDRPKDNITGSRVRKFANDVVLQQLHAGVTEQTFVQLKAAPEEASWHSIYDERDVFVLRVKKGVSVDELRDSMEKNLGRIKSNYRSQKPRRIRLLQQDIREFFSSDLLEDVA